MPLTLFWKRKLIRIHVPLTVFRKQKWIRIYVPLTSHRVSEADIDSNTYFSHLVLEA